MPPSTPPGPPFGGVFLAAAAERGRPLPGGPADEPAVHQRAPEHLEPSTQPLAVSQSCPLDRAVARHADAAFDRADERLAILDSGGEHCPKGAIAQWDT